MLDTNAAYDALKGAGPIAIVGFCMGGSVAFLAATLAFHVDEAHRIEHVGWNRKVADQAR
jgi:dienelactone hydrolase